MNTIKSIIIFAVILISLSGVTSATDWVYGNPTGLGLTNVPGDQFVVVNNNASTGDISSVDFDSLGTYTQLVRINNCDECMYGMINPVDNSVWGTDEVGNVFYTPNAFGTVDYSRGFFTVGLGGTCTGLGGNCNPLYKVATFTAPAVAPYFIIKLSVDSSGNIYSHDGRIIKRFVRSLGYSVQTIYTMPISPHVSDSFSYSVLGMNIDSTDTIHILAGERRSTEGNPADVNLIKFSISTAGTLLTTYTFPQTDFVNFGVTGGWTHGGLVVDSTNPTQNYTYGTTNKSTLSYLFHNSSLGTVDIAGGSLATFTQINDIGYNNYQIYVAGNTNLIRSYVTNYEGQSYQSGAQANPDSITGTFTWVNGFDASVSTITPGMALRYRWTTSEINDNYTYYTGWGTDTTTEPLNLYDLTDISTLTNPATFSTNSIDLAGSTIYGYLLSKRNNDSTWYLLATPVELIVSQSGVGYDSITPDKAFYNLTGDTVNVALTYGGISYIYFYQWMLCERIDCADKDVWEGVSLIGRPATSHIDTTGIKQGNYYTVLMRHLPLLPNEIVATNYIQIRPPVIGVSWDKASYNLFPKSLTTNACLDATPSYNPWSVISGYAGLQTGWFSCSTTPATATANNSIMRGSLYAAYNGTFYLNNSLGNVWNGTLSNGSGALIYTLTNSSVTETWTLVGVNQSGETFYATTEVVAESRWEYSLSVSPDPAYNQDTLYLTFTKPIWIDDYVQLKDAGGTTVFTSGKGQTSGTYYIDPAKQYTYGTWTAYWTVGSIGSVKTQGRHIYTFTVKNAGRPSTDGSVVPENSAEYTSTEITNLLSSKIFWALLFIIGIMLVVAVKERGD